MLNMFASVALPGVANAPFIVMVCPFVGLWYTVRCPGCEVVSMYTYNDGDSLREGPLWKVCERGHKFLVTHDDHFPVERVTFVDGSTDSLVMEPNKKKQRVGPSRTEALWDVEKVRERMGLVAPIDTRKPRPAPIQVLFMPMVNASPPLHSSLTRLVAAGEVQFEKKRAPLGYDADDHEVDIDATLQTMDDIAAETEMLEPDSP